MAVEHAVSLKLPTFWTSQPEVWFAQAEAQFNLRGITAEDTKYFYVLAALDQQTATRLLDLISRPPVDNKYKTLKDRLISTFGLSKHERASRLLHFRPLGDSKPSTLMDEMLALLGDHPPCLLFKQLFLERLPEDIRIQLVDSKIDDYRRLARRADATAPTPCSVDRLLDGSRQNLRLPFPLQTTDCAITIAHLEKQLGNADNPAPGRETRRPVASSGLGGRP